MKNQQFQGILLRLRKFLWDCENFAIIAKIFNLSEIVNFRKTPGFSLSTIPSEILHFRYSQEFR